jgi:hypothetical protein
VLRLYICLGPAGDNDAAVTDDTGDKVAFVLEHGIRPDRHAAEALVAAPYMRGLTLADYQQRTEVLRMFGYPLAGVPAALWRRALKGFFIPRLAFVAENACVPAQSTAHWPCRRCFCVCDVMMSLQHHHSHRLHLRGVAVRVGPTHLNLHDALKQGSTGWSPKVSHAGQTAKSHCRG